MIEFERRRRSRRLESQPAATSQASAAHGLLRLAIRSGSLAPGTMLNESQLAHTFGMSRNSVRRALQMLADEGLVTRRPKHGTFVSGDIVEIPLGGLQKIEPSWVDRDQRVTQQVLSEVEVPANLVLQERLGLTDGDTALEVEHLLHLDQSPICLRVGYMPSDAALTRTLDLESPAESRVRFEHIAPFALGTSETTLEAVASDARQSRLLGVSEGSPLLAREMLIHDRDLRPLELSYSAYPGGRASFFSRASLPGVALPGGRAV